jgi:hypothetical protein
MMLELSHACSRLIAGEMAIVSNMIAVPMLAGGGFQ